MMYDNETPTADAAQEWLSFLHFWQEKSRVMTDRFLRDFSAAWEGAPDPQPPQWYHDEAVALARKQEKDFQFSVAGLSIFTNSTGDIVIQQTGSQFVVVPAKHVQEFMTALNSLTTAPSQPVIDINRMTDQQLSRMQNELAARSLKRR